MDGWTDSKRWISCLMAKEWLWAEEEAEEEEGAKWPPELLLDGDPPLPFTTLESPTATTPPGEEEDAIGGEPSLFRGGESEVKSNAAFLPSKT